MSGTQPGTPGHPEHGAWLLALGRATFASSLVSGIAFDLLRVLGDEDAQGMYDDPLGRLESKLRGLMRRRPDIHELADFVEQLASARETRNDLLHAHPVHSGLHRRRAKDPYFVRNFFDIESLNAVREEMEAINRRGVEILYRDGGAEVRHWYGESG